MRASPDVDAALLTAIDRYLRSRGGGLDGYESRPPTPIAMRHLVSVAVRFFYPDTILPDGSVRVHVCVDMNGLKDLQTPRDLAVEAFAAGVILDDFRSEKHPLQDEFQVRLTRIQGGRPRLRKHSERPRSRRPHPAFIA